MAEDAQALSPHIPRRRRAALSIRASLVLMVLAPTIATVAVVSSVATQKWADRSHAIATQSATLELDGLMHARAAVTDEYVPSAAIIYANKLGVSIAELDHLLGIDFAGDLAKARRLVDAQPVLHTNPKLASDLTALHSFRAQIDAHTTTFAAVQSFFTRFTDDIDNSWSSRYTSLAASAPGIGSAPLAVADDITALRLSFSAFTSGLDQSTFVAAILTAPSTPSMVTQLIGADELFDTATAAFPRGLGKQATAAWVALGHNSEIKQFDSGVQLAVRTGLNRAPPPYRTNLEANAAVFRGEIAKVNDLTALVVGASADLRTTAAAQQTSTTDRLIIELVLLGLLTVAVFAVAVWLAGLVNGPLARIADAADAVRQGNLDVAPLDATGPRELAYAAGAFNEMTATLRAVESHAVALAGRDLGDPVLREPLPGRTGRALQGALDRLQDSVREADHRRAELHDLATHDSLTGLLNRGAAIEAVERDLARSGRDGSSVALLFIDLDGLKAINDTYGHEGGDAALRATGEAITSSTRLGDIRGRLGGDEFIVAHLHSGRHADVATLAERIRRCVAETELDVQGQIVRIHCSIGIAQSGAEDATAEALIARADSALYGAKQQGRNRVAWYVPLALDPA